MGQLAAQVGAPCRGSVRSCVALEPAPPLGESHAQQGGDRGCARACVLGRLQAVEMCWVRGATELWLC